MRQQTHGTTVLTALPKSSVIPAPTTTAPVVPLAADATTSLALSIAQGGNLSSSRGTAAKMATPQAQIDSLKAQFPNYDITGITVGFVTFASSVSPNDAVL